MDKMTIIGLVAILLTILYVLAVGNILHMLFNPLALIIVYGGTFSATLIAYPWAVIKEIVPSLRVMLFPSKHSDQGHGGHDRDAFARWPKRPGGTALRAWPASCRRSTTSS